jgi:hypothetical protein
MKKFLTICMALLFAGAAFAQEVKTEEKKGPALTYGFKGYAFGVTGSSADFGYDYTHVRVRPSLAVVNENVKGVVTFEIDQDFGKQDNASDGTAPGADAGTDNKVVEVKHAYMEAKDAIVPGLTFMAGLNAYFFPMVVDNDFAMLQAGYDFGMGKAVFSYIKIDEYAVMESDAAAVEENKDLQAYALDVPLKFGAISVRPGVMAIRGEKESDNFAEASLMNYAVNVKGDMGMVAFNASGAYLSGDINADTETSSYAFDANVDIKPIENIKVGAFITYATGDDDTVETEENNGYFNVMNSIFGKNESAGSGKTSSGATDGRLFLLENGSGNVTRNGGLNYYDTMDNEYGYMSYGLYVEGKFDKLTAFAQFGMASILEDEEAGDSAIGSEIDLRVDYEIGPKTVIFAQYANFMAGDLFIAPGSTTDAEGGYEVAFGMTASI